MYYLDRKALEIAEEIAAALRERLEGTRLECSDPDPDSPYASARHDRGACIYVEKDGELVADVRVEIMSSEEYEGTLEGWGFGFACTLAGGRIGPGGTVYNYTDRVWTRDREEIKERLAYLWSEAPSFGEEVGEFLATTQKED